MVKVTHGMRSAQSRREFRFMKASVGDDTNNKVREAHRRFAMGHRNSTAQRLQLLGATFVALAVLSGCGNDGSQGPAGTTGSAPVTSAAGLTADQQQALSFTGTVTSVTIPSDGKPVVNFTLTDSSGKGVTGWASSRSLRHLQRSMGFPTSFLLRRATRTFNSQLRSWFQPTRRAAPRAAG